MSRKEGGIVLGVGGDNSPCEYTAVLLRQCRPHEVHHCRPVFDCGCFRHSHVSGMSCSYNLNGLTVLAATEFEQTERACSSKGR